MRLPNTYVRYDSKPGIVMIELSQGKYAEIDEADLYLVMQYRWHAMKGGKNFYALTNVRKPDGSRTMLSLHRLLVKPGVLHVDHRNGDGLDNTRGNLRVCTHKENQSNKQLRSDNTSGFKGVYWHKSPSTWRAQIYINGANKNLGSFATALDGALKYDAAAVEEYGEFALTNKMLGLLPAGV